MAINYKIHPSALNVTTGSLQVKNGSNLYEEDVTITESGDYSYEAPAGYYGLSKVNVTVDVEEVNNEDKAVTYTANDTYTITADEEYTGLGTVTVTVDIPSDVHNQDKTVSPTTSQQTITADADYSGLGEVTVNAVTSAIDNNISSGNIKKDVTILGVTGSYDPQPTLTTLNVTPTTSAQTLTPSQEDGWNEVDVAAVDSSIDPNILSNNIKQGVTILGITGSYTAQPNLQQKSVTPTTSAQTVQADGGYDGLSEVSVSAVTSAIDSNIQSANIVSGVTILGVTGTATAGASCPDWSSIGWDCTDVNGSTIADDVAYSAQQKAAYDGGTITSFAYDSDLKYAPSITLPADCSNLFLSCSRLTDAPSFSGQPTNTSNMFKNCSSLVKQPDIDLSEVTNSTGMFRCDSYGGTVKFNPNVSLPKSTDISYMFGAGNSASTGFTSATVNAPLAENANNLFNGQRNLTSVNLTFGTGKLIQASNMFNNCIALTTVPLFDTSNVYNATSMFDYCSSLTTIPAYDFSNITSELRFYNTTSLTTIPNMTIGRFGTYNPSITFNGCSALTTIGEITVPPNLLSITFQSTINLVNLGGFIGLGRELQQGESAYVPQNFTLNLSAQTNLTKQSILNVIAGLGTMSDTTKVRTLTLSAAQYALLDASEIAVATAKGWSVTSA